MSDLRYLPSWAKLLLIWLCFLAVVIPGYATAGGRNPTAGSGGFTSSYPWQLVVTRGNGPVVLADAYDTEAECLAAASSVKANDKWTGAFCYRR